MKKCKDCGVEKALSEFYAHKTRGTQDKCKECKSAYNKIWYQSNREATIARSLARNLRVRDEILEKYLDYMQDKKCVDCGEADIVVLQHDHGASEKVGNVSRLMHDMRP